MIKMKLKHFSLSFSIIGILILYFISTLSQPANIRLEELPKYDGKKISTKGIVTDYYTTKFGSQVITIKDENYSTAVFVEGSVDLEFGDKIQVTGEVQKYDRGWEIVVNDYRLVKIIQKWQNLSFPIWQLAQNPNKYLGLNVNVTGYIESISNDYFYLVDLEEKHSIIVFYNLTKSSSLYPGQKASISAKFSFDSKNFRYKLILYEENHGITRLGSNI